MNYSQLIDRLSQRGIFRIKPGLERVQSVLAALNNPQDQLRVVHIAGTNGKGSVAAALESVLRESGYRTGLYTSPHLWDVRERIQIDREPVSVTQFWQMAKRVLDAETQSKIRLTYFEFLTAVAFLVFAAAKPDIVILEAGMGGRWDATNVVKQPVVSIITSIGLDHTEWLGKTETAIAREKAGIAKPGVPLISGVLGRAGQVIRQIAQNIADPVIHAGIDFSAELIAENWAQGTQVIDFHSTKHPCLRATIGLIGPYQTENFATALAALECLEDNGFKIDQKSVLKGLLNVSWPGRFQCWPSSESPRIVFDGAHNPPALRQFVAAVKQSPWAARRKTVVFGVYKDKDYAKMLRFIRPIADQVIFCSLPGLRGLSAELSAQAFGRKSEVSVVSDPHRALQHALASSSPDELVIVTGSLALVGLLTKDIVSSLPATHTIERMKTKKPVFAYV
jgi:dihydrofolate synthase / folylpolyglutamate synthase